MNIEQEREILRRANQGVPESLPGLDMPSYLLGVAQAVLEARAVLETAPKASERKVVSYSCDAAALQANMRVLLADERATVRRVEPYGDGYVLVRYRRGTNSEGSMILRATDVVVVYP